jgi:hypothetical protein
MLAEHSITSLMVLSLILLTEALYAQLDRIAANLAPTALTSCRDTLYALLDEQPPSATSATHTAAETAEHGDSAQYEAARRALAYADSPVVLDAQGNVVKSIEGLKDISLATLALTDNAPMLSKDLSDRDQLQKLVALQLLSSHRDVCTRMSTLLRERANALRGVLGW